MKASEIRIGNLLTKNGNTIEVKGISPHCGDYAINTEDSWVYLKNCEPILLTEKWLLRFGFERTYLSGIRSKYTHKETHCVGYDFSYVIDKSMEGFTWYGRYIKDIKYIHQLQNIYFTLTGQELIINQ